MKDGSSHSGGGGRILVRVIVLVIAVVVAINAYKAVVDTRWAEDFRQDPRTTVAETAVSAWSTIKRTVSQANPAPRPTTICSKSNDNGLRTIVTSNGEHFVLADEVSYGGEMLTAAEAYKVLKVGSAHWLRIRSVPFVDWNTHIKSIGKSPWQLEPEKCPR